MLTLGWMFKTVYIVMLHYYIVLLFILLFLDFQITREHEIKGCSVHCGDAEVFKASN